MSGKVLDNQSLQETLCRLEEARLKFTSPPKNEIDEALDWIIARHGQENCYGSLEKNGAFFAVTNSDFKNMRLPTGERLTSPAAIKHILGEEALRALVLWKRKSDPATKKGIDFLNHLLDIDETGMGKPIVPSRERGYFCCKNCTPAFLRSVNAVKTNGWEKTLVNGVAEIKAMRTPDGRWHGFPFYYTLLMLSEVESAAARQELRYTRPVAEKLIGRYENKSDRTSRFRAHVLKAALAA